MFCYTRYENLIPHSLAGGEVDSNYVKQVLKSQSERMEKMGLEKEERTVAEAMMMMTIKRISSNIFRRFFPVATPISLRLSSGAN